MQLIYVTFKDAHEAERIISGLLEAKLIACGNIMAPHTALYKWDGAVQKEQEVGSLLKSLPEKFEQIQSYILEHHSYDTPCVIAWETSDAAPDFLKWVNDEVK